MTDDLSFARAVRDPLFNVAAAALCLPPPDAVFIDPLTRERIAYASAECDVHGAPLAGVDDDGAWIGTDRACLVLDARAARYFKVRGYLGAEDWIGYVAAAREEQALEYADRLGVVDLDAETLSVDEIEFGLS